MAGPQLLKTQSQKQQIFTSGNKYRAEVVSVKDATIKGGYALEVTCLIDLGDGHTIRHPEMLQIWHDNKKAQKLNREVLLPQIAEAIGEPPDRFDNANKQAAFQVLVGKAIGVRAKMNHKLDPPKPTITGWEQWP